MLKSPLSHIFRIALSLFFLLTTYPARAENVPADLEVIGTAGGHGPDGEYATVHITADGQATYLRFESSHLMSPAAESNTFVLTPPEMEELWQAVQNGDFFNLEAEYAAEGIVDRTYAELIIKANRTVHKVTTQNIAVEGFDDIISKINALTPDDDDLIYDTSEPFTFISRDICDSTSGQMLITLSKQLNKTIEEPVVEVFTAVPQYSSNNPTSHPGSMIANHMTLQEAVNDGIVTLSAKGNGFEGDQVSIHIDNSVASVRNDRLTLSLYLDFWGSEASTFNCEAIVGAIESYWGGKTTSSGQNWMLNVVWRNTPGATSAPGLNGYHQIKVVRDLLNADTINGVLNLGVGSGTWHTAGGGLSHRFAHNAGHLFGLPNRYERYVKQPLGTWIRERGNKEFTPLALAEELVQVFYTDSNTAEVLPYVESGIRVIREELPGSEDDLMAVDTGNVKQSDIDAIAAQAGIVIEVRPGDIMVNKDGSEQSFVNYRSEDIFVPPGGKKNLEGLYVVCIDAHKDIPNAGTVFDLAPSLSDWRAIEAAQYLQLLVDYIDDNELFCSSWQSPHRAVWRITDNSSASNLDLGTYFTLLRAGIDLGDQILEFPHMTNLNSGDPNTTSFLIPPELYVLDVTYPNSNILDPGETVELTGDINAPSLEGVSYLFSWSLDTPTGSAATLSSHQGETTDFTTDVRGIYRVLMQAEVTNTAANTFTIETVAPFTAADAYTETFETGFTLEPFLWKTSQDNPWIATVGASHTGDFSLASPESMWSETATLTVTFELVDEGSMSFTYLVSTQDSNDFLVFSIDGEEKGNWSGLQKEWSTFSIDLAAGTHTAVWAYQIDEKYSEGADRVWIDNIFFPEGAIFIAIDDPADDVHPTTY